MSTDRWGTLVLAVVSVILIATGKAGPLVFAFGWIANDMWNRNEDWLGLKRKGGNQ